VLGIAVHAHLVRIHPFTDGNGRTSRLLGDLVFLATQGEVLSAYDWYRDGFDKKHYVRLLQAFDKHQDPHDLAQYIGVRPYGG
jgi:Fic family protein